MGARSKQPQSGERAPLLGRSGGSSEGKADAQKAQEGRALVVAFVLMLVFALGNRIFQKLQTLPMYRYPFFLNVLQVFFYVPLCFLYIVPMRRFGSAISDEQTQIPKHKFAVMGLMDAAAGLMQVFAVNYITNASMLVLLQQAAIPISMAISKLFLNARYSKSQYAGSAIVVCGIVSVMLPSMMGEGPATPDAKEQNQTFWSVCMVLSCIPMCLSSVYKEKALGEADIDVVYLNGWVAVFQLFGTILSAVPSAYAMHLSLSELPANTVEGFWCWMGYNPEQEARLSEGRLLGAPPDPSDCAMAPFFVTSYLIFNLVFNILMIVILKYGSANILYMSSTALVPLGNVAFSLKWMPNAQPLHRADVEGLVLIMLGLVVYRFWGSMVKAARRRARRPSLQEEEIDSLTKAVEMQESARGAKFVGLNQPADLLQPLMDTRVLKAQAVLFRSPEQIRSGLLLRLGIPPSPLVQYAGSTLKRSPVVGRESPGFRQAPAGAGGSHLPLRRSLTGELKRGAAEV